MGFWFTSPTSFFPMKINNMRACGDILVIASILSWPSPQNKTKFPILRRSLFSIISIFQRDCSFCLLWTWLGPSQAHGGPGLCWPVPRVSPVPSQWNGAHVLVITQILRCEAALWFSLEGEGKGGSLHRLQHVQNTAVRMWPVLVARAYHCNHKGTRLASCQMPNWF